MSKGAEGIRKQLKKHDRLWQDLRFVKHWVTDGKQEAIRRRREHEEEIRIRQAFKERNRLTPEQRKREEETVFPRRVLISILTPVYNTPEKYLRAMIRSVSEQTYGGWELLLADGSDGDHAYVGEIVREAAEKDPRIRYE